MSRIMEVIKKNKFPIGVRGKKKSSYGANQYEINRNFFGGKKIVAEVKCFFFPNFTYTWNVWIYWRGGGGEGGRLTRTQRPLKRKRVAERLRKWKVWKDHNRGRSSSGATFVFVTPSGRGGWVQNPPKTRYPRGHTSLARAPCRQFAECRPWTNCFSLRGNKDIGKQMTPMWRKSSLALNTRKRVLWTSLFDCGKNCTATLQPIR